MGIVSQNYTRLQIIFTKEARKTTLEFRKYKHVSIIPPARKVLNSVFTKIFSWVFRVFYDKFTAQEIFIVSGVSSAMKNNVNACAV